MNNDLFKEAFLKEQEISKRIFEVSDIHSKAREEGMRLFKKRGEIYEYRPSENWRKEYDRLVEERHKLYKIEQESFKELKELQAQYRKAYSNKLAAISEKFGYLPIWLPVFSDIRDSDLVNQDIVLMVMTNGFHLMRVYLSKISFLNKLTLLEDIYEFYESETEFYLTQKTVKFSDCILQETFYDKNENITKEINYNQEFQHSYSDILNILDINISYDNFYRFRLSRQINEKGNYYQLIDNFVGTLNKEQLGKIKEDFEEKLNKCSFQEIKINEDGEEESILNLSQCENIDIFSHSTLFWQQITIIQDLSGQIIFNEKVKNQKWHKYFYSLAHNEEIDYIRFQEQFLYLLITTKTEQDTQKNIDTLQELMENQNIDKQFLNQLKSKEQLIQEGILDANGNFIELSWWQKFVRFIVKMFSF